ncbi:MAG: hypothetical protein ACRC4N_00910 [Gammaproteobacteria bacterium]
MQNLLESNRPLNGVFLLHLKKVLALEFWELHFLIGGCNEKEKDLLAMNYSDITLAGIFTPGLNKYPF